jgi:hypothetical protein
MGVSLAIVAYSNGDRINTRAPMGDGTDCYDILRCLFPRTAFVSSGTVSLADIGIPKRGIVAAVAFEQGVIVSTIDAHLYNPSKLHHRYLKPDYSTVQVFTQRSFNDMFAYGRWSYGELGRSISVNPVGKVWESLGEPEPFEVPFWDGARAVDSYPLPFHPLEMSAAALASELNLSGEGTEPVPGMCQLDEVILTSYSHVVPDRFDPGR